MTFPALILGVVISSILGAGFHLMLGGNLGRLVLYLIFSWVGFWAGHLLGEAMGWTFLSVGPLRLGTAILTSLVLMAIGHWLSLVKPESKK